MPDRQDRNESETRAELIDPAIKAAGWGVVEGSRVRREVITLGRLQGAGTRAKQDIADYVLDLGERFRDPSDAGKSFAERIGVLPDHIRQNPIVRVPTHLVLLGRVLALLSGVNRTLGARLDLPSLILPYAR